MPDGARTSPPTIALAPRPLTAEAFAEFGSVVGPEKLVLTSTEFPFFTNVATLVPDHLPITYLNRHHDHQQIFATFDGKPMIVIVAAPRLSAAELRLEDVQAFVTDGSTAIVFHVDTWHLAPRAVGAEPIRALNVQATNNHVHTERIELAPTLGREIQLAVPRKVDLLRRIGESRAKLEREVARLDEGRLTAPGADDWSVKDHLAHVTTWEEFLLAVLEGRDREAALGIEKPTSDSEPFDVDRVNLAILRRHRDRPLADVLETFQETHARLLAALGKLTDADLLRPYSHFRPSTEPRETRPIVNWIDGNTWAHYDEHAAWIRQSAGA